MALNAGLKKRVAIFALGMLAALAAHRSDREPSPHRSRAPQRWMTVTADASNLPDRIESADVSVTYVIENVECLKPLLVSGAHRRGVHIEDVVPERMSTNQFNARIPLDAFQEEDYDGLGACRWRLSIVAFRLNAENHSFDASVAGPVVERKDSYTIYYSASSIAHAAPRQVIRGLGIPSALSPAPGEEIYQAVLSTKGTADRTAPMASRP